MNRKTALLAAIVLAAGVSGMIASDAGASGSTAFTSYACTGAAADGTTITTDLAGLQQGGTLLLSGSCGAAATPISVTVPSDVTLEGTEGSDANVGTEIFGHITETSTESVTIRSLQVNCGSAASTNGLTLDGWQLTVEHVTVSNCTNGIELDNPSGGHVNDRINYNFIQGSSAYGFYVNDSGNTITDGHFEGNYVANGTDAIHMLNTAGWYVENNHIYAQSGIGIYAARMWGSKISGNYIENWGGGYGIEGSVQNGAVASVVSGNNVFENVSGTVGSGGAVGVGIGMFANGAGSNHYVTVTGNNVINTNSAAGSYGIQFSGTGLVGVSAGNSVAGAANTSAAVSGAVKTGGV